MMRAQILIIYNNIGFHLWDIVSKDSHICTAEDMQSAGVFIFLC